MTEPGPTDYGRLTIIAVVFLFVLLIGLLWVR